MGPGGEGGERPSETSVHPKTEWSGAVFSVLSARYVPRRTTLWASRWRVRPRRSFALRAAKRMNLPKGTTDVPFWSLGLDLLDLIRLAVTIVLRS